MLQRLIIGRRWISSSSLFKLRELIQQRPLILFNENEVISKFQLLKPIKLQFKNLKP
jgi:hypothetical protein